MHVWKLQYSCNVLFVCRNFSDRKPLHLKARAAEQVMRSPMFQKPISYELNEEGIRISQDEQSVLNEWGDFRKAVSTGQSVIIYVTKVRALIFPRESLGEQYAAAVQMISTHMPAKKSISDTSVQIRRQTRR